MKINVKLINNKKKLHVIITYTYWNPTPFSTNNGRTLSWVPCIS